jgi:hypothetical protein
VKNSIVVVIWRARTSCNPLLNARERISLRHRLAPDEPIEFDPLEDSRLEKDSEALAGALAENAVPLQDDLDVENDQETQGDDPIFEGGDPMVEGDE